MACRGSLVGFGVAEKTTTPVPVPEDPVVIVSHEALLEAVHGTGVFPVVTVIDPVPPSPLILKEGELTLIVWARTLNALDNRTMATHSAALMGLLRMAGHSPRS